MVGHVLQHRRGVELEQTTQHQAVLPPVYTITLLDYRSHSQNFILYLGNVFSKQFLAMQTYASLLSLCLLEGGTSQTKHMHVYMYI